MKNNNYKSKKKMLASYGIFLGVFGLLSDLITFPNGIFTGFFFGALGITVSVLSREGSAFTKAALWGLVFSAVSLALSVVLYLSMLSFFSNLKDPVIGPEIFGYYKSFFEASGIPVASVSELLKIK